jgi:hypothetical protein
VVIRCAAVEVLPGNADPRQALHAARRSEPSRQSQICFTQSTSALRSFVGSKPKASPYANSRQSAAARILEAISLVKIDQDPAELRYPYRNKGKPTESAVGAFSSALACRP